MVNMLLAYVAYMICRLAFLAENWNLFSDHMTWGSFAEIMKGGLVFDTCNTLHQCLICPYDALSDTFEGN